MEGEEEREGEREKSEGGKQWESEVEMTLRYQGYLHQFIAFGQSGDQEGGRNECQGKTEFVGKAQNTIIHPFSARRLTVRHPSHK